MRTRMIDGVECRYVKIGENIKIGDYWQFLIEGRVVYKREEGEHFGRTRNKYHWNVWRPLRAKAKAKVLAVGWVVASYGELSREYAPFCIQVYRQKEVAKRLVRVTPRTILKRVKIVEAT